MRALTRELGVNGLYLPDQSPLLNTLLIEQYLGNGYGLLGLGLSRSHIPVPFIVEVI
jgi:hypothetical protein